MKNTNKVILVILDGLNADVGLTCMGFLQALCEQHKAKAYKLQCELPSLSRPLYECILTGVRPTDSGIYHNQINRLSKEKSVFNYCIQSNKVTAAAAYYWISELYNRSPFQAAFDRHTNDSSLPIQFGHFYYDDAYPDSHLFDDADHLRKIYRPDFLLVHSMNIDDAGHRFGLNSMQYRNAARRADMLLSNYINLWLDDGYQIIVTSDHGMNNDLSHGGNLIEEREVPFYTIGDRFTNKNMDEPIQQTEICGTICALLKVEHDKTVCRNLLK
ncbi:alkaline phosphatase family protein [Moraxella catarrhalis]|nr:alkaline phosphatase family protein [Moraxella catarrhalis]ARE66833.1 nucleotide pyrophosphatase [Moraxella catarrhalis]EKF82804.1 type I phosphodiesterase/nucleotide pyrophosphatase [Moraxella catarrhalis RH4]MCG6818642.1 alkaline phosphatase family protein [Moraxella catarrhalis]MPX05401.1 alkaline phosphatase family protein [Moraxella catarrhalis]MPX44899.1 alkaline phosphatase family protein [Moraxella catarrhalis]